MRMLCVICGSAGRPLNRPKEWEFICASCRCKTKPPEYKCGALTKQGNPCKQWKSRVKDKYCVYHERASK